MRLRNIKGSREVIINSPFVIQNPESHIGFWHDVFHNNHPIHIEVGMGKGKFLTTLASLHPEINYIGIEKYSSVLYRALEKRPDLEQDNLCFLRMDAEELPYVFDANEIDRIYLNFSDPWPKDRHAKRRLTSREFFARYDKILKQEGEVFFKTDNRPLFDFSMEEVPAAGWKLRNFTYDLHHSVYVEGNVMTEYEEKFSSLGNPIHRLVAFR